MSFYLGQDKTSWSLIKEADKVSSLSPASVLGFFDMLHSWQQWERLAHWLPEIGPLLGSHRNEHLSSYQFYWDAVIEHLPEEAEQMWSSLADMLPYAKDIYQNALITHGRWREWIDYQLSTGREPLELRVSELAPIEKNAPELLLPFTIRPSSGTSFIRTEPAIKQRSSCSNGWPSYIKSSSSRSAGICSLSHCPYETAGFVHSKKSCGEES